MDLLNDFCKKGHLVFHRAKLLLWRFFLFDNTVKVVLKNKIQDGFAIRTSPVSIKLKVFLRFFKL
jgi:hypothetical protein